MTRTSISVSKDTKAALDEQKPDGMTWDAFVRSWLEGPDESGDYPSAEDIATLTARKTANELETRLR